MPPLCLHSHRKESCLEAKSRRALCSFYGFGRDFVSPCLRILLRRFEFFLSAKNCSVFVNMELVDEAAGDPTGWIAVRGNDRIRFWRFLAGE